MNHCPSSMEPTAWLSQCQGGASKDSHQESDHQNARSDNKGKAMPMKKKVGFNMQSTLLTLKWLEENYEVTDHVCIPRSTLYYHYNDFCEKAHSHPVNPATFGKIIRQQFPLITTRRLGTRGQSKYHYYGIGIRETSIYYDAMFSATGVDGNADFKNDGMTQIVLYSPSSKIGMLLPNFPDVSDIKIPSGVDEGMVTTFLMMYHTHCQHILDTVIQESFGEVQSFLLHFWQGIPSVIVSILDCEMVVMLVGVCDSILYKVIASVMMPTAPQALPDNLVLVIRKFACQLENWMKTAINNLPDGLKKIKLGLVRHFGQILKLQTSLSDLCQTVCTLVQNPVIMTQMLDDWLNTDLDRIGMQTLYTVDHYLDKDNKIISIFCTEFVKLLEDKAPIESYIEWLNSLVDRCVVQPGLRKPGFEMQIARMFLLMWSSFTTCILRDMTLHSAPSFGSFHLLHLMFNDYVFYLVEIIYSEERANIYMRIIRGEQTEGIPEELILPDLSVFRQNMMHSNESALHELQDQNHDIMTTNDSVMTSHDSIGPIELGATIDVNTPIMHPNRLLLEAERSFYLTSESLGASALYQNCGSFPSTSHASSPTGEKTLTQLLSISGAYSTQQTYNSGSQMLDSNGRQMLSSLSISANVGVGNMSLPQDWNGISQPRQAMEPNDTTLLANRLNDPTKIVTYTTMPVHQQGMDFSYLYENPRNAVGQTLNNTSPSYLYNGYSHGNEFQMYGENSNKRQTDAEGANKECKRTKPDGYCYDNN